MGSKNMESKARSVLVKDLYCRSISANTGAGNERKCITPCERGEGKKQIV